MPGAGGVVGGGPGRVAGGGEGDDLGPEVGGPGDGRGHAPRLEAAGRVERLVLDEQVVVAGEGPAAAAAEQGRHSLAERDGIFGVSDGKDFVKPPHRADRAAANDLWGEVFAQGFEVVAGQQRLALFAEVLQAVDGVGLAGRRAGERCMHNRLRSVEWVR